MVDISKEFIKKITSKQLEYQDYGNYITALVTVFLSLLIFTISFIIAYWNQLVQNPTLFIIVGILLIGTEIVFIALLLFYHGSRKQIKQEIKKFR